MIYKRPQTPKIQTADAGDPDNTPSNYPFLNIPACFLRLGSHKRIHMTIDDTCDNGSNEDAPFCVTTCVSGVGGVP